MNSSCYGYGCRGIWSVPYIAHAVLFHGFRVQQLQGAYIKGDVDPDMALTQACREKVCVGLNIFYTKEKDWVWHKGQHHLSRVCVHGEQKAFTCASSHL